MPERFECEAPRYYKKSANTHLYHHLLAGMDSKLVNERSCSFHHQVAQGLVFWYWTIISTVVLRYGPDRLLCDAERDL